MKTKTVVRAIVAALLLATAALAVRAYMPKQASECLETNYTDIPEGFCVTFDPARADGAER